MKKLLFIAVLLFSSIAFAQATASLSLTVGSFEFETETIDYGKIPQNSNGVRTFTFKNVGNAPIIIANVKGSCGCTVATKPNDPILPGETAEIDVKYATNRIGGFSKTITITSNASETNKVIRIKGVILKETIVAIN